MFSNWTQVKHYRNGTVRFGKQCWRHSLQVWKKRPFVSIYKPRHVAEKNMETGTQHLDEQKIEIIPPAPKPRQEVKTLRCDCCRERFVSDDEDYGICRHCLEC